ncbi:MAG: hypothetical protein AAF587_19830 [Bacteroidota bacterium]
MQIQEILQRLGVYVDRIRRKWLVILLFAIPPATYLVLESFVKPPLFLATTVFHPDTGQQVGVNRENPLSLILGNPGEGGETGFMIGVLKSRNISEAVTSDSIDWKGERRLVADVIYDVYPLHPSVFSQLKAFISRKPQPLGKESKIYFMASAIRSSMSVEATPDGFINMVISFYSADMAGLISRLYIKELDEYYKKQKTAKASNSVSFYTQRADSINRELTTTTNKLARYLDQNRGNIFAKDQVYPAELRIRQDILKQMFVTLTLSKEQAAAQLQQDTPIIQVLDHPNPPYKSLRPSTMLYLMVGLVFGIFVGIFWVCRHLLYEDVEQIIRDQLLSQNKPSEKAEQEHAEESEE